MGFLGHFVFFGILGIFRVSLSFFAFLRIFRDFFRFLGFFGSLALLGFFGICLEFLCLFLFSEGILGKGFLIFLELLGLFLSFRIHRIFRDSSGCSVILGVFRDSWDFMFLVISFEYSHRGYQILWSYLRLI